MSRKSLVVPVDEWYPCLCRSLTPFPRTRVVSETVPELRSSGLLYTYWGSVGGCRSPRDVMNEEYGESLLTPVLRDSFTLVSVCRVLT